MNLDDDLWWLWCGDEGDPLLLGPFLSSDGAERNIAESNCEHAHVPFERTARQIAKTLPRGCVLAGGVIFSADGRMLVDCGTIITASYGIYREMIALSESDLKRPAPSLR